MKKQPVKRKRIKITPKIIIKNKKRYVRIGNKNIRVKSKLNNKQVLNVVIKNIINNGGKIAGKPKRKYTRRAKKPIDDTPGNDLASQQTAYNNGLGEIANLSNQLKDELHKLAMRDLEREMKKKNKKKSKDNEFTPEPDIIIEAKPKQVKKLKDGDKQKKEDFNVNNNNNKKIADEPKVVELDHKPKPDQKKVKKPTLKVEDVARYLNTSRKLTQKQIFTFLKAEGVKNISSNDAKLSLARVLVRNYLPQIETLTNDDLETHGDIILDTIKLTIERGAPRRELEKEDKKETKSNNEKHKQDMRDLKAQEEQSKKLPVDISSEIKQGKALKKTPPKVITKPTNVIEELKQETPKLKKTITVKRKIPKHPENSPLADIESGNFELKKPESTSDAQITKDAQALRYKETTNKRTYNKYPDTQIRRYMGERGYTYDIKQSAFVNAKKLVKWERYRLGDKFDISKFKKNVFNADGVNKPKEKLSENLLEEIKTGNDKLKPPSTSRAEGTAEENKDLTSLLNDAVNKAMVNRRQSVEPDDGEDNGEWEDDGAGVGDGGKEEIQDGSGKGKGLLGSSIRNMLRKYKNFGGVFAIDQIDQIPLKKKIGVILNLDPISKPGSHWVGLYIDGEKDMSVEYYDSYAEEPPMSLQRDLKKYLDQLNLKHFLKFKINRIKQQGYSNNCGWHSASFLIDRFKGKTWKNASGYSEIAKAEKNVDKLKKKYQKYGYI